MTIETSYATRLQVEALALKCHAVSAHFAKLSDDLNKRDDFAALHKDHFYLLRHEVDHCEIIALGIQISLDFNLDSELAPW